MAVDYTLGTGFVVTPTMLIDDFVISMPKNMAQDFQAGDLTRLIDKSDFIREDSVSEETIYRDFVTSLDPEELEFLASYSDALESHIAFSCREADFQMMQSL